MRKYLPWIALAAALAIGVAFWLKKRKAPAQGIVVNGQAVATPATNAVPPVTPPSAAPPAPFDIKKSLDGAGDLFRAFTGVKETGLAGVYTFATGIFGGK